MEVGIVGLPTVGKTTLFNALTGQHAEAYGDKAHIAVAEIPDPRLATIASYIKTRKVVPATIQLVDIPGMPAGSDAKKLNTMMEQIRQVDALCHVVRCFDDGSRPVGPEADITTMETELVLADLVVADSAKQKADKLARRGDRDAMARLDVLEKATATLEAGEPVRSMEGLTDAERALLNGYGFVSAKTVVFVANVAEDDAAGTSEAAEQVKAHAVSVGSEYVIVSAGIEAELAELDEADRGEMLESLGLSEPAIGPLARAALAGLGLTIFYTAGDKEIRAWPVRVGSTAPEAAGAVHTDMQRGFIRAECYAIDDLVEHHTEKAIREAGKLRVEGKHYTVQDGDVVHFLFNV